MNGLWVLITVVATSLAGCAAPPPNAQILKDPVSQTVARELSLNEERDDATVVVLADLNLARSIQWECNASHLTKNPDWITEAWYSQAAADVATARIWSTKRPQSPDAKSDLNDRVAIATYQKVGRAFGTGIVTDQSCSRARDFMARRSNFNSNGSPGVRDSRTSFVLFRAEKEYEIPRDLRVDYQSQVRVYFPGISDLPSLIAATDAQRQGNTSDAIAVYRRLASRNVAGAAFSIAEIYEKDKLQAHDAANAFRWYYAAWLLGHPQALQLMSARLSSGSGVAADKYAAAAALLGAFQGASPDVSRHLIQDWAALTPNLTQGQMAQLGCLTNGELDKLLTSKLQRSIDEVLVFGPHRPHERLSMSFKGKSDAVWLTQPCK